jgi:hypothetical protein
MQAWCERWPLLLAALWWGGLSGLGFVAVPMAFAFFGNPAVAGPFAAKLFQVQAWFSVFAALALILWGRYQRSHSPEVTARWALLPWLLLAALAALLQEHAVAERILTARGTGGNLRLWHAVGTGLILLQWLSALRVLWWFGQRTAAPPPQA